MSSEEVDDLKQIQQALMALLRAHEGLLVFTGDAGSSVEAKGTKEVMQGKAKVDGHYFASIVMKPKDVRFYFFPIYTHAAAFDPSPAVRTALKGKSCFHLKPASWSEAMESEFKEMIDEGVRLYKADGLI